ncbi:MAG: endonuclease III domain-containing protein [Candidatus Omnitrophica bacterium]|nr:endonuclease III domain-containing protein [Candidatus Omnitrophota bacterium]
MVGAILTQNTAWSNVEKAINNLKRKKLLTPQKMMRVPAKNLKTLIRPSGFYNEKAKKLKNFAEFLIKFSNGNVDKLKSYNASTLRRKLLSVKGIGPETADSILLYALDKPVFVVDAYTKRIFARHKLLPRDATYEETQKFFTRALPRKTKLFNEYHALIVEVGKNYCRKKRPLCEICPLKVVK